MYVIINYNRNAGTARPRAQSSVSLPGWMFQSLVAVHGNPAAARRKAADVAERLCRYHKPGKSGGMSYAVQEELFRQLTQHPAGVIEKKAGA